MSQNSNVVCYKYQENGNDTRKCNTRWTTQKPQQHVFWLLRQLHFYAFFEHFMLFCESVNLKFNRFFCWLFWIETAANFGEHRRRLRLLISSRLQTHLRRKGHDCQVARAEVDNCSLPNAWTVIAKLQKFSEKILSKIFRKKLEKNFTEKRV